MFNCAAKNLSSLIAASISTKLASLACEYAKYFMQRIKILQNSMKLWENNSQAAIIERSAREPVNLLDEQQMRHDLPEPVDLDEKKKLVHLNDQTRAVVLPPQAKTLGRKSIVINTQMIPKLPLKIRNTGCQRPMIRQLGCHTNKWEKGSLFSAWSSHKTRMPLC